MRHLTRSVLVALVGVAFTGVPSHADRPGGGCEAFLPAIQDVTRLVSSQGIANSLIAKLNAAGGAAMRGQVPTSLNILNAFQNEVNAQSGHQIDTQAAATLNRDAQSLIGYVQGEGMNSRSR